MLFSRHRGRQGDWGNEGSETRGAKRHESRPKGGATRVTTGGRGRLERHESLPLKKARRSGAMSRQNRGGTNWGARQGPFGESESE
jgi:hypothetical protein